MFVFFSLYFMFGVSIVKFKFLIGFFISYFVFIPIFSRGFSYNSPFFLSNNVFFFFYLGTFFNGSK